MPRRTALERREEFKSEAVKIPIASHLKMQQWVNDYYPHCLTALVVSSDFKLPTGEKAERELIYVEGNSRNSRLQLWDFAHSDKAGRYQPFSIEGTYDRDEETEKITAIYLKQDYVYTTAYPGTLEELLAAHIKAL